ncbi:LysM domain-containing protein [Rhodoluna sp.]|uniref:LysM peptidoglycan-binding domain-containing protein n=1 Tax=Rhodoluna sp. TaxID=1969481 RepID=UPI0025E4C985|nr:LysM domain-containing protein [Rhodoluna sp.]
MIPRRFSRLVAILTSTLLVAASFIAIAATSNTDNSEAAVASQFDPGLIIGDSVFYDFGTMTADDVQKFLESKLPSCNNANGMKCIKDFRMDTPAVNGEDGRCESLPSQVNQSAARMIYVIANACKINPRVLIVTLQKEQGLITNGNPTKRSYDFALGMNCPDTASGCSASSAGFFWQLYKGAGQLQWYGDPRGSFTFLKVGQNITRRYQDKQVETAKGINCGSKTFQLKSQATAALYYYTPYTPNAAAMANLYGSGDACSAYGNRNFWRYYTDWFGSPVGGGFLLKSETSGTYLIVEDKKYLINEPALVTALKPLGPLGTISQTYLDSFTSAGELTRLVKSAAGIYYFLADAQKYTFTNCDQVAGFGLDCTKAIQLTANQLAALGIGGPVTEYVSGVDGDTYLIQGGAKRQILDNESLVDSRIGVPALSKLKISALAYLPWGKPIMRKGSLFTNAATKKLAIYDGELYYDIAADSQADINFAPWFTASAGVMKSEALAAIASKQTIRTIVNSAAGQQYLLTAAGKRKVSAQTPLVGDAPTISDSLLSAISDSTAPTLNTPVFIKSTTKKDVYLAADGAKRLLPTATDRVKFNPAVFDNTLLTVPESAIEQIELGNPVLAPASYVTTGSANYWIDGLKRALVISSADQAALLGLGSAKRVAASQLAGYYKKTKANGIKYRCDDQYYVVVTGKFHSISASDAADYPGTALKLSEHNCLAITKATVAMGRFIKTSDTKKIFLIDDGKKRLVASTAAYEKLRGDGLAYVVVGPYFASKIATGTAAPKTMPASEAATEATPSPSTSPSPTVSPSPSASPKPTVSATPTVSPSPKASPTPSPSPSVSAPAKTYKVVAGDSITAIAKKFGVTSTALMAANKIANANLIKIGQVLIIP